MQKNQLLATLPRNERERLEPYLERVSLDLNQILAEFDKPIEHVYFPDTVITSTVVRSPTGSTVEVGLMGTEGMTGLSLLLLQEVSNSTVLVQVPGEATRMSADAFTRHVRDGDGALRTRLLRYTNFFMAMIAQTSACNASHPVQERLAKWLLMVHDRVQENSFRLTQEYLAVMLGVRRSGVSEHARKMKAQGLIDYSRGSVIIIDRAELEDYSCECYGLIADLSRRILADSLR